MQVIQNLIIIGMGQIGFSTLGHILSKNQGITLCIGRNIPLQSVKFSRLLRNAIIYLKPLCDDLGDFPTSQQNSSNNHHHTYSQKGDKWQITTEIFDQSVNNGYLDWSFVDDNGIGQLLIASLIIQHTRLDCVLSRR